MYVFSIKGIGVRQNSVQKSSTGTRLILLNNIRSVISFQTKAAGRKGGRKTNPIEQDAPYEDRGVGFGDEVIERRYWWAAKFQLLSLNEFPWDEFCRIPPFQFNQLSTQGIFCAHPINVESSGGPDMKWGLVFSSFSSLRFNFGSLPVFSLNLSAWNSIGILI